MIRVAAITVFLVCIAAQIFIPPFIGIGNNGDFGKVSGHLSLSPADGSDSNFIYFQPDYLHAARYYWDSPYWSSETVLGWIALRLAGATGEGAHFDVRALAAVHLIFWLAALVVLLATLRGRALLVVIPAIFFFTDVCYAAYLNTFYMDTAALCGMFLMTAGAVWIANAKSPSPWKIAVFGAAALLFVTCKTQHAIWFVLPAAFLLWRGLRSKGRTRLAAFCASAIVCAGGATLLGTADPTNRDQALFNKLFFQIGTSADGASVLRELGVREDELLYIGTHSYVPGSPADNREWVNAFYRHTGYPRLFGWYLRNPGRALSIMRDVLYKDAPEMRQNNLSNFRRVDGRPRAARTNRFALWSDARSWLLNRWPWVAVIWYVVFTAGALYWRAPLGWIGLGIATIGAGEFAVAALADCQETGRHLLMFHVCTDLTILFGIAWAISRLRHAR
jgi:hypothetical protein